MLTDTALEVAKDRYFLEGEDWEGCSHRVAHTLAQIEPDYTRYVNEFRDIIQNQLFIPAGRILRNCGRPKGSLLNCYNIPIGDSIEEIGQHTKDTLTLWSEGGGTGTNYSPLRPIEAIIKGKGGTSSGLVSFLKANNSFARTIKSGGSRRAAGKADCIIYHPEVMDFIRAKLVDGELECYNISVSIVDKFLDAVREDREWEFKFQQKTGYGSINAKALWESIIRSMVETGEPGLINWNNLQKNNSYYCAPVTSTNPCGEVPLEDFGACDLGSLVLPNFIAAKNTNWIKMAETIHTGVRLLDNVLDVNKYALDRIKRNCMSLRRVGLGYMGLADYLFKKELRYGSPEALLEIEKLQKFIRNTCYEASIELAKEKGAFPKYESGPYGDAAFVRSLPANIRMDIRSYGVRNCTLMAMPPTGTTSLVGGCEPGVEPLFSKGYWRDDRISKRPYVHKLCKDFMKDGKLEVPDWFVDSYDIQVKDHLETQAIIQKYTDGAVSKTINVPHDYDYKDMSKLLLEYIHDLKGVTVYRDGAKAGQILKPMTHKEIAKHLDANQREESDVECKGTCAI
jgi:ribonucleoside-diphosphate reductase alpha chain